MAEDYFTALRWLHSHSSELHVNLFRIAMMDHTGRGGIAAGTCILARDSAVQPAIAKQIIIYLMLDDRTTVPDPALVPFMNFNYEDNITCWSAVLGKTVAELEEIHNLNANISPYASPARGVT